MKPKRLSRLELDCGDHGIVVDPRTWDAGVGRIWNPFVFLEQKKIRPKAKEFCRVMAYELVSGRNCGTKGSVTAVFLKKATLENLRAPRPCGAGEWHLWLRPQFK